MSHSDRVIRGAKRCASGSTSRCAIGLIAVTIWLTGPALAQQRELQPGQRVRLSLDCAADASRPTQMACPTDGVVTGSLVRISSESLVLEASGSTATYPLPSLTLVEASRGSTSRWKAGGLVGFVAGTALTFAVLNSGNPSSTNLCDPEHNQDAIGGPGKCLLIAGAAAGIPAGVIGMFVGSRLRTERWEEVPLGGLGLTLLPLGSRAYVGGSVRVP